MRVSLIPLLNHAAENGYAVAAFNINNAEQAIAVGQRTKQRQVPFRDLP